MPVIVILFSLGEKDTKSLSIVSFSRSNKTLPFAIIFFYLVYESGNLDFGINSIKLSLLLIIAGPMTVIPLFLYIKGIELSGLGPSGMIFFITPTSQFLLGYFYYNEPFSTEKFTSFIFIWIAVFIYLKDIYEKN